MGSSFDIAKRIKNHFSRLKTKNHINPHLQASYDKYGKDNFIWEILEQCSVDSLLEREQFWMDETRCYDRSVGFNNCIKADSPLGYKHTDENKKRMSELKKGKKLKPEHVAKISKVNIGRKHSQETKRKMSESKLGKKNPMFGVKEDEDHKKERMKGCLSVPRWNKGLTKNDDSRILKLASRKNKTPPNALKCKLLNKKTGEIWTADSLAKLADKCPISLPTIHRLKNGTCGKATKQVYELEYES